MSTCIACGSPFAYMTLRNVPLCKQCEPIVRDEIVRRKKEGLKWDTRSVARHIYRENNPLMRYELKNVPEELWTRARVYCAQNNVTMKHLICQALEIVLKSEVKP